MATTKQLDIHSVWGALVELLQELTKLAKNANQSIEDERAAGQRPHPNATRVPR